MRLVKPIAQAAALVCITLGTGAAAVTVLNEDVPDMAVPEAPWGPGGELDGRSFFIEAELDNGVEGETDTLVFEDGGFLSMDCEEYCAFGVSDYRTWVEGGTIHFTATARCPTAPHTVVWHGRVEGERISVEMSWTTRRWYWTHQIMGTGTGAEVTGTGTGTGVGTGAGAGADGDAALPG